MKTFALCKKSKRISKPNGMADSLKLAKTLQKKTKVEQNLWRFLGYAIISFCKSSQNAHFIESALNKKSKHITYPQNFQFAFKAAALNDWIVNENLSENFEDLETLKKLWSFKTLPLGEAKDVKTCHFMCVMRRISVYFLNNEVYKTVFKKMGEGNLKLEVAIYYMKMIAPLLRLIKNI